MIVKNPTILGKSSSFKKISMVYGYIFINVILMVMESIVEGKGKGQKTVKLVVMKSIVEGKRNGKKK